MAENQDDTRVKKIAGMLYRPASDAGCAQQRSQHPRLAVKSRRDDVAQKGNCFTSEGGRDPQARRHNRPPASKAADQGDGRARQLDGPISFRPAFAADDAAARVAVGDRRVFDMRAALGARAEVRHVPAELEHVHLEKGNDRRNVSPFEPAERIGEQIVLVSLYSESLVLPFSLKKI